MRRYGDVRVNAACETALAAEMLSVHRLARLLALAAPPPPPPAARILPLARYLRPATHYALPRPAAPGAGGLGRVIMLFCGSAGEPPLLGEARDHAEEESHEHASAGAGKRAKSSPP